MTRFLAALTATAALAALVAVAPAGAADKPAPCAGFLLTDKTGDQAFDATGLGLTSDKAQDNADITGLFFNYAEGKLTANIEIAKLDKTLPSPSDAQGGIWYYVTYTYKSETRFVRAANADGSTISYAYGSIDPMTGVYTTDGDTKGSFSEGDKGVVSIEVPADKGGKLGETLSLAGATADYIQGNDDMVGLNNHVDTAPDDNTSGTSGKNYKVADCPAAPVATTGPTGPTGPTPTPTATPDPTTGPGTTPPPSNDTASDSGLPFRSSNTIGKASKAKKGSKLSFKVNATKPITNLKVTLKKPTGKGKALASGKLKRLSGVATLKLKLRKKLKKGRYLLIATGTVDGTSKTARQPVLIK